MNRNSALFPPVLLAPAADRERQHRPEHNPDRSRPNEATLIAPALQIVEPLIEVSLAYVVRKQTAARVQEPVSASNAIAFTALTYPVDKPRAKRLEAINHDGQQ